MRTKASCAAGGRALYALGFPCGSCEMTASSHASQSAVAVRADVGVRGLHQPRVRREQVAVAVGLRDAGAKSLPLLRKEAADAPVEPVDLRPPASWSRRR